MGNCFSVIASLGFPAKEAVAHGVTDDGDVLLRMESLQCCSWGAVYGRDLGNRVLGRSAGMRRVCAWSGGPSEGADAQSLRVRSAEKAVKTEVHGFGIVKRPPGQTTGRRFVLRLVTCLFLCL